MRKETPVWIVLVDSKGARLLQGTRSDRGSPRLGDVAAMQRPPDDREYGRPSMVATGGGPHSFTPERNTVEEDIRRHAKEVAAWTAKEVEARRLDDVHVFAPDRLLGELRKEWPKHVKERVREHHGDFLHLQRKSLLDESAVLRVFAG